MLDFVISTGGRNLSCAWNKQDFSHTFEMTKAVLFPFSCLPLVSLCNTDKIKHRMTKRGHTFDNDKAGMRDNKE
jgi:hypothetical protein